MLSTIVRIGHCPFSVRPITSNNKGIVAIDGDLLARDGVSLGGLYRRLHDHEQETVMDV
jgi:hypothetical protein